MQNLAYLVMLYAMEAVLDLASAPVITLVKTLVLLVVPPDVEERAKALQDQRIIVDAQVLVVVPLINQLAVQYVIHHVKPFVQLHVT